MFGPGDPVGKEEAVHVVRLSCVGPEVEGPGWVASPMRTPRLRCIGRLAWHRFEAKWEGTLLPDSPRASLSLGLSEDKGQDNGG